MTDRVLDWPDDLAKLQTRVFHLISQNLRSAALLTGELLTAGPTSQRWVAELEFPPRAAAEWRRVDGLLAQLRGTSGFVRMGDYARQGPAYNETVAKTTEPWSDATTWDDGSGWQSGPLPASVAAFENAARGARSILTGGFPVSITKALAPGDLFEIRPSGNPATFGHLYIITGYANTDANGQTRIEFEPGLRTGVAVGDQVVLDDPKTVFRLQGDDQGGTSVDSMLIGRLGISLVEVLPRS
jgi:hypothetical protein